MRVKVLHVDGAIVFAFGPPASVITSFLVANSDEQVLWEVEPLKDYTRSSQRFAPIVSSDFVGIEMSRGIEENMREAAEAEWAQYPALTTLTYGEIPLGYGELVRATKLTLGTKYCFVVFGAGLESTSDFFIA